MRKTASGLGIAALGFALCAALGGTAHADPYRWCAVHNYGDVSENCYFRTFEQCRGSLSGGDDFCRPNSYYTGEAAPRPSRGYRPAPNWR